ncbi:DNA translocase FtsK 4TM domain-containing protein [Sphingoaurantiacus capsulatus]|uniref:DNA translocase FtsK n=1 Tax=Sphingoaurantiacus capsulatus TaxID=1771310 RepID=A0ABV7XHD2_9SPHN
MAKGQAIRRSSLIPEAWVAAMRTAGVVAAGGAFVLLAIGLALALATYDPADPSLNHATSRVPANWLGGFGAGFADLLLQALGLGAVLLIPLVAAIGVRIARGQPLDRWRRYVIATILGALVAAVALGATGLGASWLPAGLGGAVGFIGQGALGGVMALLPPSVPSLAVAIVPALLLGIASLSLFVWGLGVDREDWRELFGRVRGEPDGYDDEDYDDEDDAEEAGEVAPARPRVRAPVIDDADESPAAPRARILGRTAAPAPSKRVAKERQSSLDLGDTYKLPALNLLKEPPKSSGQKVDAAALEQNARLLESVLEDFGVKGEIVEVRPGPVVTMYELEPAPGIKASRVIGLADDIARSMSAISARVAVVPGRNVIGIELPNARREMVSLSELLSSVAFEDRSAALPLVLGKNIAGDPVIADLAPMPHLLIAGTTGSGKSVGLNAMILSLLYRLTPEQCRMIMIDPKMLELSVYDGIPHLLSPVVTEPQKAIRALKWAVEQMEDRYRMMASINVRSLAGFNQKVREAAAKNQPFTRKVHTGYDPETGQPIYETETLEFEPLPLVVVVVDELADLMMTAGKEVEFLIQRLAQKARAAGIHLIMATQRPSVDVITGVIKANLPTRISFQVTSKIDSRTILGEQGAEQLLGKGDMLYMPGGKQIIRVHGPFVSDEEVEGVAAHWKDQGHPDYVQAVTEEPAEGGSFGFDTDGDDEEGDLYRRAIQVVAESQKASTSYIQRQLRIGYNGAARLIERMEKDGYVGQADHVGRREVLVDPDGTRVN